MMRSVNSWGRECIVACYSRLAAADAMYHLSCFPGLASLYVLRNDKNCLQMSGLQLEELTNVRTASANDFLAVICTRMSELRRKLGLYKLPDLEAAIPVTHHTEKNQKLVQR